MSHLTKEQKLQQQTQQIFNIAEKPIMEYIAVFLEELPAVIFHDDIPKESDPLILLPIQEHKKDVYFKFTLKVIESENKESEINRINDINDIIKYDNIKESIGFLVYCINSVLPSIIASNMINNKPMLHIDLKLNESNWSFYPVFKHDLTIKKNFCEDSISKIIYMKQQKEESLSDEMMDDLNKELNNIIQSMSKINLAITPEILDEEKNINMSYVNKPILGIYVTEISKDQLPKPKYVNNEQQLPVISNKSYEDPY
jgi:hypothetical protein